ncbi:unnamed protein product [Rhizopus microsporus]
MGQTKSKDAILSRKTHFTKKEIQDLRDKVNHKDNNISAEDFKQTVKKCVPSVSSEDDVFLEQLYAAFAGDNQKLSLDFDEFVDGLSVFMKGNEQEKLALSFKLYDVNHDGYLTKPELERVLLKLSVTFSKEDRTAEIKEMVDQLFKDFDVDNDDKLSFEEYKLSAMKEPLMVDFLEQFLSEHHMSSTASVRSNSPVYRKAEVLLKRSPERKLSRPTSMTSLDAALTSMH